MAITPSSRWISKDGGSDEDSVPFEKSKKACFQFSATLGLRTVLPDTPYSVSDRFILKIKKSNRYCWEMICSREKEIVSSPYPIVICHITVKKTLRTTVHRTDLLVSCRTRLWVKWKTKKSNRKRS